MGQIFGIGTDIVEKSRFEYINIEKLAKRILTHYELLEFENAKDKKHFLAKKFSIKESISKAFGVGIGARLSFLDMETSHDSKGKPVCEIKNNRSFAITHSKVCVHITSSDTKTLIITHCVVEVT